MHEFEMLHMSLPDIRLAAARSDMANASGEALLNFAKAFEGYSNAALGFTLPIDWTGEIEIVAASGWYGLMAKCKHDKPKFLINCDSETQANGLVERLELINTLSQRIRTT